MCICPLITKTKLIENGQKLAEEGDLQGALFLYKNALLIQVYYSSDNVLLTNEERWCEGSAAPIDTPLIEMHTAKTLSAMGEYSDAFYYCRNTYMYYVDEFGPKNPLTIEAFDFLIDIIIEMVTRRQIALRA